MTLGLIMMVEVIRHRLDHAAMGRPYLTAVLYAECNSCEKKKTALMDIVTFIALYAHTMLLITQSQSLSDDMRYCGILCLFVTIISQGDGQGG